MSGIEISPLLQAKLLLSCAVLGLVVGAVYDMLRLSGIFFGIRYHQRRYKRIESLKIPFVKKPLSYSKKNGGKAVGERIFVAVVDFACFVLSAVVMCVLCYGYNNGKFRVFGLLGGIFGLFLYRIALRKVILEILSPVFSMFRYAFCSFFVIFGYPIGIFLKFFVKYIKKLLFLCSFTIENKCKKVYNKKQNKKTQKNAPRRAAKEHFSPSLESISADTQVRHKCRICITSSASRVNAVANTVGDDSNLARARKPKKIKGRKNGGE